MAGQHIYQFPDSYGFDGQMYHYVAHDPLMRSPELKASVDTPWLRYRRVLVPGFLAYLLAMGRADWVDRAYDAIVLIFIAGGTYWIALYCQARGFAVVWGLLFLLIPATIISVDRILVLDVALVALTAAFAWYGPKPSWRLFTVLALAALARETGFLLIAGYCGFLLLHRQPGRGALFACAAAPALVWYAYVRAHTPAESYAFSLVPLRAITHAWLHPLPYPPGMRLVWVAMLGDRLALAGILTAFGLVLYWSAKRPMDASSLVALAFVGMGLIVQRDDHWLHVYDYGRVYSPVLLILWLWGFERKSWLAAAPFAMLLPRIGMQIWPQIVGVL